MSGWRAALARVYAVAAKEFLQLRRDRVTGGMIVGLPLLQILIFGYGINFDVRHLPAAVADHANSSASRALVADLAATQVLRFTVAAGSGEELRDLLAKGAVSAALYIPADFERRRLEPDRPVAQLLVDGSEPGIESAMRALAEIPLSGRPADGRAAAGSASPTLALRIEYNPERRTAVQIVPALIGVILSMTMIVFTAIALVRERERGNLELLITTPVQPAELMVGKLLPYVLVGLIQTTLILLTALLLFDVPVNGSPWQLYAGAGLFIAATLALGLLISTVARTQFQAMQLGLMVMLPSILLSGALFPFEGMPAPVRAIAQVLPLTHFNEIVRGVLLRGAELAALASPIGKLLIFLVAVLTAAMLRFRKRLG